MEEREDPYLDKYWIQELGLKMHDKYLIQGGYWINDRIIVAASKLMRKVNSEVNGLNDLALAEKYGYVITADNERFVQIINVRKVHWITLSNIQSDLDQVFIYDSLMSLNVRGEDKISFPINVEQTACQLLRPNWNYLEMCVVDVQQQQGGKDCGLFAILFAVALCLGKNPIQSNVKQSMLRTSIIDCFEKRDINPLLDAVSFRENSTNTNTILYQWDCKVYCHCRMPDDGNLMVPCSSCKEWFHGSCESGDFEDSEWVCTKCDKKQKMSRFRKEKEIKEHIQEEAKRRKRFEELRKAAGEQESQDIKDIYNCINNIVLKRLLPSGEQVIQSMDLDDYNRITGESREILGVTIYDDVIDDLLIVIFVDRHKTKENVLDTAIHEIAHAVHSREKTGGAPHGKEYSKVGRKLTTEIKAIQHKFPKPYCSFFIDTKRILYAKCQG